MSIPLPATSQSSSRGYLIATGASVLLSTTAILMRYLTVNFQIPPLVLAFWRDAFVALSLLPILALFQAKILRVGRPFWSYLLAYGLVLAVFNSLWTISVAVNGAAVATVLAYCSGGFTALLGRWLLKERLDAAKLLAVAFCLGGCVLVSKALDPAAWQANPAGILTGILSGFFYALYTLMGRSAAQRGLNPWQTLLYTFGSAACFLLIFNLLGGERLPGAAIQPVDLFWLQKAWIGWGVLLLLAAGPSLAGFGLYNISLSLLPSSVANLILTSEPVFTAIIAYLLLGEHLDAIQLAGGVLILAGVVFLRISEARPVVPLPRPLASSD